MSVTVTKTKHETLVQLVKRTMENLLEQAIGLDNQSWPLQGRVLLIQDCVHTSGAFLLHHLIKRALSSRSSNVVFFFSFSHPVAHYDRILRKLGCNLAAQKDNNRFFFFDMLTLQCPDGAEAEKTGGGLMALYAKIRKTINALPADSKNCVTVMIDDVSLMEAAANGSSNHVLDFLHYCHTLTSQINCSLVVLNHEDIYLEMERPLMLQMEYLADILIKVEPLATGLAADVHGQLTILNKGCCVGQGSSLSKTSNFHFKVKENGADYFYPGSRT